MLTNENSTSGTKIQNKLRDGWTFRFPVVTNSDKNWRIFVPNNVNDVDVEELIRLSAIVNDAVTYLLQYEKILNYLQIINI